MDLIINKKNLKKLNLKEIKIDDLIQKITLISEKVLSEIPKEHHDDLFNNPTGMDLLSQSFVNNSSLFKNIFNDIDNKVEVLDEKQNKLSNNVISSSKKEKVDDNLCVICFSKNREISFIHGKTAHLCCCEECAENIRIRKNECPICRKNIENSIKTFT